MEVIGGGGKEELCRDLFCFSAPRLLAIGEKQDNGRRAADRVARIILRVSYLSPTVVCICRLCSFYKTWR